MSDDEDDYLSDKFLVGTSSAPAVAAPKTYSQLRKDAEKQAMLKNEQNRHKSRFQLERETREEGLKKSLFERAEEEPVAGNKALNMMMKMGFKPGQVLGKVDDDESVEVTSQSHNKAEPLPINEWEGRQGIGLGKKRARSPGSVLRVAKMAKMEEQTSHADFRDRTRQIYEQRRAQAKLGPAQRTCMSLDEKAGKSFHVLWLNPEDPTTFPEGLLDALAIHSPLTITATGDNIEGRLARQMRAEALRPLDDNDATAEFGPEDPDEYADSLEETVQFLRLQAPDRLRLVLTYLREQYAYCFWCGTQYDTQTALDQECPGPDEEAHD